jgi:hypothetical protein
MRAPGSLSLHAATSGRTTMSTDKALTIVPRTIDEVRTLATMLSKSSLLPPDLRGKEADVAVSILAGQELGMPPMAAIRGVHVVKGKPVLSADAMVGVVLGRGIAKYFRCVDESPESVTYETLRNGDPEPQRMSWTMEDARRAHLAGGDNWKKYPRAMLKARCKAALARDVYPDVLAGCYTDDEAREFDAPGPRTEPARKQDPPAQRNAQHEDVENVEDAEVVDSVSDQANAAREKAVAAMGHVLDLIDAAEDEGQLRSLAPQLAALPPAVKEEARATYKVRLDYLRGLAAAEAAA